MACGLFSLGNDTLSDFRFSCPELFKNLSKFMVHCRYFKVIKSALLDHMYQVFWKEMIDWLIYTVELDIDIFGSEYFLKYEVYS